MTDRPLIYAGLSVFVLATTFPVWYNVAARTDPAAPALARPTAAEVARVRGDSPQGGGAACVAPRDFMRASHMRLLIAWREDVVRRGDRRFVASDGHTYEKNLAATCWTCHDKARFCDRCHQYAGASPACGDCHLN